ncbi:type II restriction endonuclease [Cereibacter sphaeroides f. sp. denitrificans]|nr:restriction endonuclease [Cereibacter sphaeroides f. sp. denitrificans]
MSNCEAVLEWLRALCNSYNLAPVAIFQRKGDHAWPFTASDSEDLERKLGEGGHFLPLPKESAALANIVEVSLVDYLLDSVSGLDDVELIRGTERGYPDIELTGSRFEGRHFAIDIKAARRKTGARGRVSERKTQSRITLYTGNTYFKYPQLHWPNTFRPFEDYAAHLDIIAIYTLDEARHGRILDLELIVQEAWRLGSKQRSSTTREYIGAVDDIDRLRKGLGDFETEEAFYKFWRNYNFKVGASVSKQLAKLLTQRHGK